MAKGILVTASPSVQILCTMRVDGVMGRLVNKVRVAAKHVLP